MSITVFQIHNVLRTYDHLFKSKSDRTAQKHETPESKPPEVSASIDQVTISEQSRERLSQYETFHTSNEE